jgi:signal transduction histidine kinase
MDISIYSILIWIVAIIIGSLDLVIYLGNRQPSSRAFFFSIFWVFTWITSLGFLVGSNEIAISSFLAKTNYFIGSMIATSFLYFFLIFPHDTKPRKNIVIGLFILELVFAYLFLFTDTIINNVFQIDSPARWGWHFGILSFLFEITFIGFFTYGVITLFKKYKYETNLNTKKNLKFMLMTIIIGSVPPSVMCIILPRFGNFSLNWLGPITEIVWIPIISYSIIKYQQMNVKTVITEVLAISMTTIFFINIFTNFSTSIWLRITIFIVFIILAILLILSTLRESTQKLQLLALNSTLEQRVSEQTAEVKKAFELEKKARRELEKLNETKDQFIIMAQHHLRSPVNNISSEVNKMLIDSGNGDERYTLSLTRMKDWVARLSRIVDDFLGIASLKVGSNILNVSDMRIAPIIDDILDELRIDIENMKVFVNYQRDDIYWPIIKVDSNKIREAILIVIENAVRYNRVGGHIDINTKINHDTFEMDFVNTGVGITYEEKSKLFSKPFFRGGRAKANHPIGMGIGLTIARAIIKGHHGDINVSSDGEDMGAKVSINIPIDFIKQMKAIG